MNKRDKKPLLDEKNSEAGFTRKTDSFIHNFLQTQNQMVVSIKGNYYTSIFDFILREGSFCQPAKLTRVETSIVTDAVMRLKFKPEQKKCFYNSQLLVLGDTYRMLKYVEGFATNSVLPVLHAWCEINGKVVDITWKDENQSRLGVFGDKIGYLGVTIPIDKIRERVFKTETTDSLIDDRTNGFPLLRKRFIK